MNFSSKSTQSLNSMCVSYNHNINRKEGQCILLDPTEPTWGRSIGLSRNTVKCPSLSISYFYYLSFLNQNNTRLRTSFYSRGSFFSHSCLTSFGRGTSIKQKNPFANANLPLADQIFPKSASQTLFN